MSNYRDEHGAEVAYNPALRGGPGSTGEALFRTYLIETLLAISADLEAIASTSEVRGSARGQKKEIDVPLCGIISHIDNPTRLRYGIEVKDTSLCDHCKHKQKVCTSGTITAGEDDRLHTEEHATTCVCTATGFTWTQEPTCPNFKSAETPRTVRPPEFVLCSHEQVIHVGGIVGGGTDEAQS